MVNRKDSEAGVPVFSSAVTAGCLALLAKRAIKRVLASLGQSH